MIHTKNVKTFTGKNGEQIRGNNGRTLVSRLAVYFYRRGQPFSATRQQKQELGKILAAKLWSDGKKIRMVKTKIKEPEGEFDVIVYPQFFVKVVDATIHEYFKSIPLPEPIKPTQP